MTKKEMKGQKIETATLVEEKFSSPLTRDSMFQPILTAHAQASPLLARTHTEVINFGLFLFLHSF